MANICIKIIMINIIFMYFLATWRTCAGMGVVSTSSSCDESSKKLLPLPLTSAQASVPWRTSSTTETTRSARTILKIKDQTACLDSLQDPPLHKTTTRIWTVTVTTSLQFWQILGIMEGRLPGLHGLRVGWRKVTLTHSSVKRQDRWGVTGAWLCGLWKDTAIIVRSLQLRLISHREIFCFWL